MGGHPALGDGTDAAAQQENGGGKGLKTAQGEVPRRLREEVEAENRDWDELRRCHQLHREMVELTVYSPFARSVAPLPAGVGRGVDSAFDQDGGDGDEKQGGGKGKGWGRPQIDYPKILRYACRSLPVALR